MGDWQQRIQQANQQRQQKKLWRQRQSLQSVQDVVVVRAGKSLINFCSNDYLGLAAEGGSDLATAAEKWGFGSGASHLVCGHSDAHHQLEQALADHVGYPRALLCSSGFSANLAVISALTDRHDLIFQDKLNHASLLDGAQLSRAQLYRYRHNDMEHLEDLLEQFEKPDRYSLIVSDSVFSMDGDIAELQQLAELAAAPHRQLMIDDAHGFGVLGEQGQGCRYAFHLTPEQCPIYIGTLGKSLGGYGAFIAGSDELIDYLIQFARPYIYSTALPPALADAMLQQLKRLQQGDRQQRLGQRIKYFRQRAFELGIELMPSDTAIQPLVVGRSDIALTISDALEARGFWVSAIRPPTVPVGSARLRFTLSANHTEQHIDDLLTALHAVLEQQLPSCLREQVSQ